MYQLYPYKYENGIVVVLLYIFVFGLIFSSISYKYEQERSSHIPLSFSEIGQIEKDAKKQKYQLKSLNVYLAGTNDASMKIFESWNIANEKNSYSVENAFAKELEIIIDPTYKYHKYNFLDLVNLINIKSVESNKELYIFYNLSYKLKSVKFNLEKIWGEKHIDHYHTEYYTVQVCSTDSKGRSQCRSKLRSRQIYDYTDHYYYYNSQYDHISVNLLKNIYKEPEFIMLPMIQNELKVSSITNADGEYAAEKSRYFFNGRKMLDILQMKKISEEWLLNSLFMNRINLIHDENSKLPNQIVEIEKMREDKSFYSYRTFSHIDNGPKPYRINNYTLNIVLSLIDNIEDIRNSIIFTINNISKLSHKIKELIAIELDRKEGNSEEIAEEVLDLSKEIYNINFSKNDIPQMTYWFILWFIFGGIIGGVIGFFILENSELSKD